jgi:LmbE family N-acetylglucosaminyl deacetylase
VNVVVLAPHTDDEALGCGGTIAKLVERGYDVYVYAFSAGTATDREFNASVHTLGGVPFLFQDVQTRNFSLRRQEILDSLIFIREQHSPKMVFMPAGDDIHQDHQVINQEGVRAFKHSTIYGYECPWNSTGFKNTCYSTLSGDHIEKKMKALQAYESQAGRVYFKDEGMLSLARVRGMQANTEYAECFEVIRQFL